MEITNSIKAKVFAQYLGHQVQVRKKNDSDKDYLTGRICEVTLKSNHGDWIMVRFDDVHTVTNNTWNESSSNAHTFFFGEDETKLILKPLSSISDEDAKEVARIVNWEYSNNPISNAHFDLVGLADNLDTMFSQWGFETCIHVLDFLRLIQFLQSKGYDMPQYLLDGKTLHECNLAIYE